MTNETQIVPTVAKPVAPWIGVGESGEWSSVADAMDACGLNFHVTDKDLQFSWDDEQGDGSALTYYNTVPGYKATVRTDTHDPLGVVSNTYRIVQNEDIFSMLDPFVKMGGTITHGGMTAQGLCFMIVTMENANVAEDDYTINVMATNSFNGAFPATLICSPVRIICQNMYRQLMNNSDSVASFRHSLNVGGRLETLKSAYDMFTGYKDLFAHDVERLKSLPAAHTIDEFVELMFPYTNNNEESARYQSSKDRVDERRAFYVNHYYNSPTNSDHGTCFALVNAYYDYMSHDVPVRKTDEEYRDARLSKIVGGKMVSPKLMNFMCQSK